MIPVPYYQAPQPVPQTYTLPAPAQPYRPAPAGWQSSPTPSPVLAAQAAQINQPKARGYAPEAPPTPATPPPFKLPSPEQLGLNVQPTPTAPQVDWNATHARLRQLGATGFHLDHLPGGVTRVTVVLPTNPSDPVVVLASSDAAAIATMFERIGR